MHPAKSVILFTTLSGAGFGMLFWLGAGIPGTEGVSAFWLAAWFALAFGLAAGGLLASTFHLGRPERFLKAFTQWRSSWLSREAWASVFALATMGVYAAAAVFFGIEIRAVGILGAALCLATVLSTAMIYAQLRTVPRWRHPLTAPHFLAYALAGGALQTGLASMAVALLALAALAQVALWLSGDRALSRSGTTLATATGLGPAPRPFEPPHTGPNYLTREMAFEVGRRHAVKLRLVSVALSCVLPVAILAVAGGSAVAGLAVATACHLAGVGAARWLFFAEAEHVVSLYYPRQPR